jgi:preprotein translocase subunit SecG
MCLRYGGECSVKTVIMILQVISAIGIIGTVLLQSGKSAGLSGTISGGAEHFFGKKKGIDDLLSRLTAIMAAAFLIFSLLSAIV